MIVVRIELHKYRTREVETIGTAIITNDGTGDMPKRGNYLVAVGRRGASPDPLNIVRNPARRGKVLGFPRLSYNVWRLVIRALRSAFPEEQ